MDLGHRRPAARLARARRAHGEGRLETHPAGLGGQRQDMDGPLHRRPASGAVSGTEAARASRGVVMLSFLIVTAALASPPASAAGPRLEVGNPSVTGASLRPYTNEWEFTQQRPGGEPVVAGRWTDALEATTFEGRPAWKRTQ